MILKKKKTTSLAIFLKGWKTKIKNALYGLQQCTQKEITLVYLSFEAAFEIK